MKKNIILGVTGSIAAYKAADIANTLTKEGHSVHVIMTKAGMEFITPLTMQTLTKNKVHTDQFAPYVPSEVEHISLAQKADLFLVAPASADFIAKAAAGIADDMLTTVLLATRNVPILVAPAMNTAMYENPITQRNIRTCPRQRPDNRSFRRPVGTGYNSSRHQILSVSSSGSRCRWHPTAARWHRLLHWHL